MTLAPEPLGFRWRGSSPRLARTHSGIFTSQRSTPPRSRASLPWERSPTMKRFRLIRGFGGMLASPDHFRRRITRLVSYYALFKGWLLLSQPPSCLSRPTSFPTQHALRDLSRRSGFLPSRDRTLSLRPCLPGFITWAFGVCLGSVAPSGPSPMQCSTSQAHLPRPYLNTFRGEPAISELDWPFTPIHSSSERFSTHNGSALHRVLPRLQPGHG